MHPVAVTLLNFALSGEIERAICRLVSLFLRGVVARTVRMFGEMTWDGKNVRLIPKLVRCSASLLI